VRVVVLAATVVLLGLGATIVQPIVATVAHAQEVLDADANAG
jgi:hypothetical protein